jgi:hypothetical protein
MDISTIARPFKVGTKALMEEFEKIIIKDQQKKNHDNLLDELKLAIKENASKSHQWDNKAMDSLVFIYL